MKLSIGSLKWIKGRVGESTYGNLVSILPGGRIEELVNAFADNSPVMTQIRGQITQTHPPGGNTEASISSTTSPSRTPGSPFKPITRNSPPDSGQRPPLPRSSGTKEPFHGKPVYTEVPGIQQGYGGESSEEDTLPAKQSTLGRTKATTMELTSDSGDLPTNSLSDRPKLRQTKAKHNGQIMAASIIPWVGFEIRRSLTKVPKDQQALLDRPDSWFPPEPGRRFPTANIPLQTLQQLNIAAEKRVLHNQQGQDTTSVGDEDAGNDGGSETMSEPEQPESTPVLPWSSSPYNAVDALPPDSSASFASVEVQDGLTKSLPIRRSSNKRQLVEMAIDSDRSDRSERKRREPTFQNSPPNPLHQRSSSEESVIDFTPPQGVKKEPLTGIPPDDQLDFKKSLPETPNLKPTSDRAKRPAGSPPPGPSSKRNKAPASAQRKGSDLRSSLQQVAHKSEGNRVLHQIPKSTVKGKVASPRSEIDRSARLSSTSAIMTPSARPIHNVPSSRNGGRDMQRDVPPHPALSERYSPSDRISNVELPKTFTTHHRQSEVSGRPIKSESPAQSSRALTPRSVSRSGQLQEEVDIYEQFARTYSEYPGDRKHFYNLCKKLADMQSKGKAQHRSHWDDYIIRHKTDYVPYLAEITAEGGDVISYDDYYRDEVDEPLTRQRIIGPATLKTAVEQSLALSAGQSTPISAASTENRTKAGAASMLPPNIPMRMPDSPEIKLESREEDDEMVDLTQLDGPSTPQHYDTNREFASSSRNPAH